MTRDRRPYHAVSGPSGAWPFTYQLLQQTAPKAKTFSKQTAVDTLTVPLAG